jgi:hypothetical protein
MHYRETFDDGPGGWCGFIDNYHGGKPLPVVDGAIRSYSPWWIDYNHAPPHGAGYLHLLMILNTRGPFTERLNEIAGPNRFARSGCPRDFRDAKVTLRLKGEVELRGAQLVLLLQATIDGICTGWLLTGRPFAVTPEWSEQTVTCTLDPQDWVNLGTRPERADMYGFLPLESVLADVNTNIMLVLFPLDVLPMGPINGDLSQLRAGRDYPVWQSRLPEGYVMVDSIKIEFASNSTS